jgi:hypothetical protein
VPFRSKIEGKHNKGIGLCSHDEARVHKGGMRIGKKPPPKKKKNKIAFDVPNAKELMQKL